LGVLEQLEHNCACFAVTLDLLVGGVA